MKAVYMFELTTIRDDTYLVYGKDKEEAYCIGAREKRVDKSYFKSCVLIGCTGKDRYCVRCLCIRPASEFLPRGRTCLQCRDVA